MSINLRPELIIFDCDGTIVDSEFLYNKVISDILIEQGLKEYDVNTCLELFTGLTLKAIREQVEEKHDLDLSESLTSDLYVARAQAEMDKNVQSIEGAHELLETCAKHTKICVGSNGERSSVIKSLKLTGLYDYFGGKDDQIFTKIQVENAKPAPDLFLYAAKQMQVLSRNCLVIEDSEAGVQAAVAADIQVLGFTGANHEPEKLAIKLKKAGASEIFDSLIHISERLYGTKQFLNASQAW